MSGRYLESHYQVKFMCSDTTQIINQSNRLRSRLRSAVGGTLTQTLYKFSRLNSKLEEPRQRIPSQPEYVSNEDSHIPWQVYNRRFAPEQKLCLRKKRKEPKHLSRFSRFLAVAFKADRVQKWRRKALTAVI